MAGSAVGSAGGDVGRLHGNGRCQLHLFQQFYINLYLYAKNEKPAGITYVRPHGKKSAFINLFQDVLQWGNTDVSHAFRFACDPENGLVRRYKF